MEQDEIRLSVVIPMYQASKFIRECLNSVLKQNINELEIICVDDGSTDGTLKIIHEMMNIDSRIRLFLLPHSGVSHARNVGMNQANGHYIMFLDADDMLMPGKLPSVLRKAEQKQSDILVFSGTSNMPYSTPLWIREAFSASNRFYKTFTPEMFLCEKSCRPSACNKLYRNQYLKSHQYYFPEDLSLAEDHVFQFIVFPKAKNIVFTRCRLYFYRIQQKYSTMGYYIQKKDERIKQHRKAMELVAKVWNGEKYLTKTAFQRIYVTTYLELLYDELLNMSYSKRVTYAVSIYRDLQRFGVDTFPSKRLRILQCYSENRIEEAEQLMKKISKQSRIQKVWIKLSGPIRYYKKVGLHSTVEHYIGRLLRIEP